MTKKVKRLFEQFQPEHYDLNLAIDHEKMTFSGTVVVHGKKVGRPSQRLTLHQKDLKIASAKIKKHDKKGDQEITVSRLNCHDSYNEVRLHSKQMIYPGSYTLTLEFSGKITDQMHGIYPCYFKDGKHKKSLIATQFESHHAREAFPCVDEPEAKATFDVTLKTEKGVTVLGNMPVKQQKTKADSLITSFETTPRMSSYLLAWVVGEMHSKSARTKRGIDVSIWATPVQPAENLDFALNIATKSIDFYEDYFGVDYPLPKCDHVALPDFSSGAMENWGLITYREVALLADPKSSGVSTKHFIATVIAHELAHQWFGNLVTMKWWDNLWLNESFADFVEHIAVDHLQPEWNTWLDFILSRGIGALRRDAIDGVQAVQAPVNHPDEINSLFDAAIVYGKGARTMKMLRAFVGEEAFRTGLKEYFKKYAYKNTEGKNLWDCLSKASSKDVAGFMEAWILQSGYPVLSVSADGLSQEQFFIGEHAHSDKTWPILLSAEPKSADLPDIFDTKSLKIKIDPNQRFNSDNTSHYVTRYDKKHLATLLANVDSYPTIDRLTLLNDQSLLVRGRYESSEVLIGLLDSYQNETNDAVWRIMSMTLGELKKFVETDEKAEAKLKSLSRKVAAKQYARLGATESAKDSVEDSKLRVTALAMMLYGEDGSAIDATLARFDFDKLADLPSEIRPVIIEAAVRFGKDKSLVDKLMKLYVNTTSSELKEDIALAATSTRDPATAKKLLDSCLDTNIIRPQDVLPWYIYLLRNRWTREISWRWLRDNWQWVIDTFGGDKSYDEFVRYSAGGLMNPKQLAEYKDFFGPMLTEPSLKRTILMGISEIEARLKILEEDGPKVRTALLKLKG